MNIVCELNKIGNPFITLDKNVESELRVPHTLKCFFENWEFIKAYFENNLEVNVTNIDQYIDFLFIEYFLKYEDVIESLVKGYKVKFQEMMFETKRQSEKYSKSTIIRYLFNYYIDVFDYQEKYISNSIHRITIETFIKYSNGLIDSGILEYLIENKPILVFDNLCNMHKIITKENPDLLKKLLLSDKNFNEIIQYRYKNLCGYAILFYRIEKKDLAELICNNLYVYSLGVVSNKRENHIYFIQNIVSETVRTFESIKYYRTKELSEILANINIEVNEYLTEHGQIFEFTLTSEPYEKWMGELDRDNMSPILKYMTITHEYNTQELWVSLLEKAANEYEPSVTDFASSVISTNEYFTEDKINFIDLKIKRFTMVLFYWMKDEKQKAEISNMLVFTIKEMYRIVGVNNKTNEVENDIKYLIEFIGKTNENGGSRVNNYFGGFFIISLLERILRNVFCQIREDGYFKESTATLAEILGDKKFVDPKMESIIGKHHIRWIRYYLTHDGDHVGVELRNRIAHYRDVQIEDIDNLEVYRLAWLFISTINSIFTNLINENEEEI